MLHPFLQSNTPATPITPKYYTLLKSTVRKSNWSFGASSSPKPHQQSYEVQNWPHLWPYRQHLRIGASDASQPPTHGKLDRSSCLTFDHEFSKESTCYPWNYRSSIKGSSINLEQEAVRRVEWLISRPRKPQLTDRIFRNLITRRDRLDDDSLNDLLSAAGKTIFGGSLSGRVCWKWSKGQPEYDHELLGTTAPRRAPSSVGGFETLIILSKPLLKDTTRYTRDLLLSTFLHELIHSYLFITCGLDHAKGDGHTEGFQKIAQLIDRYFGHERLHLCNMQANLSYFLVSSPTISRRNYPLGWESSGLESRPQSVPLCDRLVDEGYHSRDSSPGSIRSPRLPDCTVIKLDRARSGETESHCIRNGKRIKTQH